MGWTPPPPRLCSLCSLKVYPVEELLVDGVLYHKACFRCQTCAKVRHACITRLRRHRQPLRRRTTGAAGRPTG